MANPINLNGLKFGTLKAANEHFKALRVGMFEDEARVTYDGDYDAFNLLHYVYTEYCTLTRYPIPSEPAAFYVKNIAASGNGTSWGTTAAFHVQFKDGSEEDFSINKALSVIAKYQKTGKYSPGVRAAAPDDLSV